MERNYVGPTPVADYFGMIAIPFSNTYRYPASRVSRQLVLGAVWQYHHETVLGFDMCQIKYYEKWTPEIRQALESRLIPRMEESIKTLAKKSRKKR